MRYVAPRVEAAVTARSSVAESCIISLETGCNESWLGVYRIVARSLPRRRGPRPLSPTGRPRQCRGAPARQLAWRGRGVLFAGRWTRVGMRVKAWGCECTMRSYLALSSSKLNLSKRVLLQCQAQRSNQQKR